MTPKLKRIALTACFVVIFLVAGLVRLYQLNLNPPSLNWDEVSIGYNAYSVLKTGKDEWGDFLPLSFRAYGDYKLAGYIYLDVPFVGLFGLTEWGVRLPSALLGIGTVGLIYLIAKLLFKRQLLSLLAMLMAGLLPWAIILSRIALEANLTLFLTTLAFYLLLLGLSKKKYLPVSALVLGLSLFAYNSSRVVVLPLVVSVAVLVWPSLGRFKMESLTALVIIGVFVAVTMPLGLFIDSSARYQWTTLLDQGAINRIDIAQGASSLPHPLARLIYNRPVYFLESAAQNYLSYLNPNFLFLNGGSNYQFSVPGSGLLPLVLIPLLALGLIRAVRLRKRVWYLVIAWLLIAPIPGSVTRDTPHALRSLLMIPPLILLSALGLEYLMRLLKSQWVVGAVLVLLVVSLGWETLLFWNNYGGSYRTNYSWSWQYGYKQAVDYTLTHYAGYRKIIFSKVYGEPHEFVLFYSGYDPESYQNSPNLIRYKRSDWYWVDQFDKYIFVNDWEVKQKLSSEHDALLATSPGNYPAGGQLLKTIDFLNGQAAFDIVRLP